METEALSYWLIKFKMIDNLIELLVDKKLITQKEASNLYDSIGWEK